MKKGSIALVMILAVMLVVGTACVGNSRSGENSYNLVEDELQLAVTGYLTNSSHSDPIVIGSSAIAICELLGPDELLLGVPDGCRVANCRDIDGTAACGGCSNTNHYEWRLDDNENVYSVCFGNDCDNNTTDGYQGVWP